jgi:hypothetical protein
MLLSDAERKKFSEYLKRDAESNRLIAKQMESMPGLPKALYEHKIKEAEAAELIAKSLDSGESVTIRG